ncbi:hypothetical protein BDV27DRAFT_160818 [Aspergillus caelatus]|uniref:GILT family thiol reductase n=1 Tax=Aspergillus caelatus TaxID=61420 RepID=A0A5N6ZUK8_9EURO|nr:uncharacterized protein BDV27DRAFT_160818 [Aspergillus caelatus]KAE8361304.1 hypothetical protein BDV27DRAFT_160818 [Aspergillus caelatus]
MEKQSNESSITSSPTHSQTQVSRLHSLLQYCVIAPCLVLAGICFSSFGFADARQTGYTHGSSYAATRKVPFEVHIESRCPDARDCLQKLVAPAYWQVEDKVDFRISYVGEVWEKPRREVTCQHGMNECKGNKLLVCSEKHADSIGDALDFNTCVLSDYERVPDEGLIKECAQEHNIDYQQISDCANREEGLELLISSVERSVAVNANASCTVRVDDNVWCSRDNYEWKCPPGRGVVENLVEEIRKLSEDGEDSTRYL